MRPLIEQIHAVLIKRRLTISIAESCTGGLISSLLTQLSGSSQYFIAGIVAYNNAIKEKVLKIPHNLITKKGAVSKEVAKNLAKSIRQLTRTNFGIGITGIAGPTGSSSEKPVGTVFIAIDSKNRKLCEKFLFKGNRAIIKRKAALKTLELLKTILRDSIKA